MLVCALVLWLVYFLLSQRGFDWRLARTSIARLRWGWLVLSLIPIFGTYYGRALRWAVFLKPLKPHPSIPNLLRATIIGFTAITLFGRPGEFVRPYLIAIKERVPVTSQFGAWTIERIFDVLMALLVFAFALTHAGSGLRVGAKLAWVMAIGGRAVGVACLALLAILLSLRHFTEPVRRRLLRALRFLPEAHFLRMEKLIGAFVQGIESTRSDAALMLVFVYSVIEWLLIAASYWSLARAFSGTLSLSLVDVLIFMGFVSFGAAIQIPGIGGGMQVAAVLVLTELFGVQLELATSFAFFVWILTFVAIVPVGLVLALKEGLDWHALRRIGREAAT